MDGLPVRLTVLAEAMGTKPERLHEARKRRDDPLPTHTPPGCTKPHYVYMDEFRAWERRDEERRKR